MSRTIVVADIGGTHARFAIAHIDGGKVVDLGEPVTMGTSEHASFQLAWQDFCARNPGDEPDAIGIAFAGLLIGTFGLGWARSPTLLPALAIGLVTVVAPLFVLQPALGLGIASSKTAAPVFNCTKSIVTHGVFGLGLYLAALASVGLFRAPE